MVKEFTRVGDLDILKAESGEELARQTHIHRLDTIASDFSNSAKGIGNSNIIIL